MDKGSSQIGWQKKNLAILKLDILFLPLLSFSWRCNLHVTYAAWLLCSLSSELKKLMKLSNFEQTEISLLAEAVELLFYIQFQSPLLKSQVVILCVSKAITSISQVMVIFWAIILSHIF